MDHKPLWLNLMWLVLHSFGSIKDDVNLVEVLLLPTRPHIRSFRILMIDGNLTWLDLTWLEVWYIPAFNLIDLILIHRTSPPLLRGDKYWYTKVWWWCITIRQLMLMFWLSNGSTLYIDYDSLTRYLAFDFCLWQCPYDSDLQSTCLIMFWLFDFELVMTRPALLEEWIGWTAANNVYWDPDQIIYTYLHLFCIIADD